MHCFRLQNCSLLSLQFMLKITALFWLTNSYLSPFRVVFSLLGHSLLLLYTDLCLLWSETFFFIWQLESIAYCCPWVWVWVLLVFPPSFKTQLDACSTSLLHSFPMQGRPRVSPRGCYNRSCGQDPSSICSTLSLPFGSFQHFYWFLKGSSMLIAQLHVSR